MRVAVVGAGVFGCVIATDLARAGVEVTLFDRHPDIIWGASRACQGRLHRGYHYPRSPATATAAEESFHAFADRFPESVNQHFRHHYLIAAEDSQTSAAAFLGHLRRQRLPYRACAPPVVNSVSVDMCVRVPEAIIDIKGLRAHLRSDLMAADVHVHCDTPVSVGPAGWVDYDRVIDCTYGALGHRPLRYEVCETALIKLGEHFRGQSFVVMDGPFVSLDPIPGHDFHMLYDVRHSVHAAAEGELPDTPVLDLVDRGRIFADETHVDAMTHTLRRYLRGVGMPHYAGSLFAVRAVLPDVDDTDERPTLVEDDGAVIRVLSGKIGTAVTAARQVVAMVTGATVPA